MNFICRRNQVQDGLGGCRKAQKSAGGRRNVQAGAEEGIGVLCMQARRPGSQDSGPSTWLLRASKIYR